MAVIGKIREQSTLVLIIIGGAIIAFILTDLFSAKAGGGQEVINLAEMDGETISHQEYDAKVQLAYENYQKRTQQDLDERTKSSIRESVWSEMMSDRLIGREMDDLGVVVTKKELFDLVQGDNPDPQVRQAFTDPATGQFNSALVIQFLQNLESDPEQKAQWVQFERGLKRNRRMQKYNDLVKTGLYLPTALAKMQYNDNNTALAFKYVYKPYNSIVDSTVPVSEDEIQAYYNKTKADYEQKASRKVAYAYIPVVPSVKDQERTKEWVDNTARKFETAKNDSTFVNANSDNRFNPTYYSVKTAPAGIDTMLWSQEAGYVAEPKLLGNTWSIYKVKSSKIAPDSIKARHILVSAQTNTQERAEAIIDSALTVLNNGGSFDSLLSISDDRTSAENGGDLGWIAEGMMVTPMNDAAFAAEVGVYTKVESPFGFHILEVTERTEEVKKIQVAIINRDVEASEETYEELFNKANSFSISVKDMESFRTELSTQNLQQRTAVLSENDNSIQGLEASRDLARWVQEANEGDVSEAKDVDEAFVVAIVETVDEEGIAPLERVRNKVEFLARQEKKAEILKKELNVAATIGEVASKTGLSVELANVTFASPSIPAIGIEPEVVGTAMSLTPGQLSQPIEGTNGVFVVSVDKKAEAGEPNVAQIRDSEKRAIAARIDNGAVFNAIKEKSNVVDNRSKFY